MALTQEFIQKVLAMTNEDQRALNRILVDAIKSRAHMQNAVMAHAFNKGDKVSFHSRRTGTCYGAVVSVKRTNIEVRTDGGVIWNVPAGMLTKA